MFILLIIGFENYIGVAYLYSGYTCWEIDWNYGVITSSNGLGWYDIGGSKFILISGLKFFISFSKKSQS